MSKEAEGRREASRRRAKAGPCKEQRIFPPQVRVATGTIDERAALHPEEESLAREMGAARRREFAAGRACARRALAALGVPEAPVLRGPRRAPRWPEGVVGSITHSGTFCAAAVAHRAELAGLGIDAEPLKALSKRAVERICSEAEREALCALPDLDPAVWALVLFSAKESLYKSYFPLTGTFLGFRDAEIELQPETQHTGRIRTRLLREDAPDAAGRRRFEGRFQIDDPRVVTGIVVPAP